MSRRVVNCDNVVTIKPAALGSFVITEFCLSSDEFLVPSRISCTAGCSLLIWCLKSHWHFPSLRVLMVNWYKLLPLQMHVLYAIKESYQPEEKEILLNGDLQHTVGHTVWFSTVIWSSLFHLKIRITKLWNKMRKKWSRNFSLCFNSTLHNILYVMMCLALLSHWGHFQDSF